MVRHVGTFPHPVATPKGRIISKDQLFKEYPDCFEGIGRFPGNHKIHLKGGVRPVIHPQWKWPIAMQEKLKAKLQEIDHKGIIIKVTEPTDWINSLVCLWKPNGDLTVCLDPKNLNKAIKWTFHKIPTLEEVTYKFAGSRFFSKLDAKSAFWCIALDEELAYLTTFGTVFGRYQYLIMPYGLIDSQDAFQAKMDQILEGLEGVVSIADDIVVHGTTEEQHNDNMQKLMERARQNGLIFNPDKCLLKADSIMFFGCLYDKNGV